VSGLVQIMGKKCQNAAAAHARQARWLAPCSSDDLVDSSTHVDATPIVVDVDSSSECGYTGGVDVDSCYDHVQLRALSGYSGLIAAL